MDDVMGRFVQGFDNRLDTLFGLVGSLDEDDRERVLAHIEDRVREQVDKLTGTLRTKDDHTRTNRRPPRA